MPPHPALILSLVPILPLIAGLACRRQSSESAGRLAVIAAGASSVLAVLLALSVAPFPGFLFRLDGVSSVMVVLVAFLGTVVLRFSRHYLAGDPAQSRFFSWMSLTLASVLTLVLSGNLLLLFVAWVSTSLCLHRLLLHHPERAGAVFSARKKFVFSRVGDICLLAAALLLFRIHDSWNFDVLFASVAAGNTAGLSTVGLLLVACAALKSAQFPFHSWLPDTMETPTPVSAFMHAGIINAGGFLIVRFSPLFAHAPAALNLLVVIGTVTAAFGAVSMLAQSGVKRALAFSTIAQMGFMLLQCGLGAFGLALLHIVAHSLYKAHAFLTAGSTVGSVPRAAILLSPPALTLGLLTGGLIVTGGATAWHALAPSLGPAHGFLGGIGTGACLWPCPCLVVRWWSCPGLARRLGRTSDRRDHLCSAQPSAAFLSPRAEVPEPPPLLTGFVAAVFLVLFVFQALLCRTGHHPIFRRLYVHALNGFYLGTLANRLLGKLWPRHPIS
ncbi:MAG: proton-conducting transporter membrane subunit [Verrucomicrobiales bacterium]